MRQRILKPEFFVNEDLAALGPLAMLLFAGLWCAADREGRLEDRPAKLKVVCLPYFDCDPNALLQGLHDAGFIVRYQINARKYLEICNFLRHQKPHEREVGSVIPAKHSQGAAKVRPRRTLISETAPTLYTDTDTEKETGKEKETGSGSEKRKDSEYAAEFEQCWAIYPARDGSNSKRDAFTAWKACRQRGAGVEDQELIEAVGRYRKWADATSTTGTKFVLQASTFFGPSERWRERWIIPASRNGARPISSVDLAKQLVDEAQARQDAAHGELK